MKNQKQLYKELRTKFGVYHSTQVAKDIRMVAKVIHDSAIEHMLDIVKGSQNSFELGESLMEKFNELLEKEQERFAWCSIAETYKDEDDPDKKWSMRCSATRDTEVYCDCACDFKTREQNDATRIKYPINKEVK